MSRFRFDELQFIFTEAAIEYGPATTSTAASVFDALVNFATTVPGLTRDVLAQEARQYIDALGRIEVDIVRYSASTGLTWDMRQMLIEQWVPRCIEVMASLVSAAPEQLSELADELTDVATQGRLCLQGLQATPEAPDQDESAPL